MSLQQIIERQDFDLRDGQIVELRDFADRASALDAHRRMVELGVGA